MLKHFISRCAPIVLLSCLLVCASGATCMRRRPTLPEFAPPVAFESMPGIEQICQVINRSRNIQQLQSNAVTIRSPEVPKLHATLAWQREKDFRVRAGVLALTGTDMDIGSNQQFFWMATRHGPAPQLYYAEHAAFESQLNRQVLPVSPLWLVEAMGIVEIDPYTIVGAPQIRADGLLEVQTAQQSSAGTYQRTVVIDAKYGYVRQVLLRDPSGRLLAHANLGDHEYYESVEYSLPRSIQVQLIPSGSPTLNLEFTVGYYSVNSLQGDDPGRFTMPDARGYQVVDLARLNLGLPTGTQNPPSPVPGGLPPVSMYPNPPSVVPATTYRGFDTPTIMR